MRLPEFITFTGIDENTDPISLLKINADYPNLAEFGVLFSPKLQGIGNRYPELEIIEEIVAPLSETLSFSAHLCGEYATRVLSNETPNLPFELFERVQINTRNTFDAQKLLNFSKIIDNKPVIIQCRDEQTFPDNLSSNKLLWLYDKSGGRGTRITAWPSVYKDNVMVGFAGGITPENVSEILNEIDCPIPYWIDMETGIRTNDWFDIFKVREVLTVVYGLPKKVGK